MDLPVCAGKSPIVLELDAGSYFWCGCGLSKTQPFCDGSHAGTTLGPTEIVLTERKRIGFCTCKQSTKGAICDGSHKQLK